MLKLVLIGPCKSRRVGIYTSIVAWFLLRLSLTMVRLRQVVWYILRTLSTMFFLRLVFLSPAAQHTMWGDTPDD